MDEREMMAVVESILFVSGDPVESREIARILDMDLRMLRKFMKKLIDCFNFEGRGLQIIMVNDTYQLATRPEYSSYIEKHIGQAQTQKLSQASLETLAIIAYRQPVTKSDIEAVRGVKCDYIINTLINRELIHETGRMSTPGRPILYGTTDLFLRSFGLSTLEELPPLEMDEKDAAVFFSENEKK
ncbi:MAG TPA: SMC-Scp complex subunit ScpB [Clostridiales bacterium]|nr:SMC-Scp complex subunit ScpB [Clostridia bacterium]MDD4680240.1 SMC-Scp complex subunit ScpB [Clostridia bacterium]HCS75690.1 SMC-Scp complex subunit ScpB [Clostridiales bacterium]